MPGQVVAAVQRVAFEAEQDEALRPHIPAGGLMAAARTVRDRLAAGPIVVTVPGEGGGKPVAVTIGLGDVQQSLVPCRLRGRMTRLRHRPVLLPLTAAEAREIVEGRRPLDTAYRAADRHGDRGQCPARAPAAHRSGAGPGRVLEFRDLPGLGHPGHR